MTEPQVLQRDELVPGRPVPNGPDEHARTLDRLVERYRQTGDVNRAATDVGVHHNTAARELHRRRLVEWEKSTPWAVEDEAVRLYGELGRVAEVGERLGISDTAVCRVLHERGVETSGYRRGGTRTLTWERPDGEAVEIALRGDHDLGAVRAVLDGYARGKRPSALSRRHRIPVSTIEKLCERAGITRRRHRAARLSANAKLGLQRGEIGPLKAESERLYLDGRSVQAVVDKLSEGSAALGRPIELSVGAVYDWLRRRGVIRRKAETLGYRPARLSDAEREDLQAFAERLYLAPMGPREVSERIEAARGVRLAPQTVTCWMRDRGVVRTHREALHVRYHSPYTAEGKRRREQAGEAWRLLGEGRTRAEIAREMDVSPARLRSLLSDD